METIKKNMMKVGIIGAGVMGSDIALELACYGYDVILKDIDNTRLEEAKNKIVNSFKMVKMTKKDLQIRDIDSIMKLINFALDYKGFENLDFVIENIPENWDMKKELYHDLINYCSNDVIFAVNTSCISITKIASLVKFPENVIGMHFMNPVPLKKVVEVVKGFHTSEETIETSKIFIKSLSKTPIVVNDYPGFVANRLSHLFMNEAAFLVQDNVASPKEIDMIFKKGYNHAMGPLETADLIGLDTVVNSLEVLYDSYQDPKFRCCPLLKRMIDAGLLGKKSGKGFYNYTM